MNKRGQSIIEYSLIAILVIVGIVVMGPYVLRSINAHFQLWDEGVHDSFDENMVQAPVNAVPPINTNCRCTVKQHCGNALPGSLCLANELEVDTICTPPGCGGGSTCVSDPSCCSLLPGNCGTLPLNQTQPSNDNCNYGYQINFQQCGSVSAIQCLKPSAFTCPPPQCIYDPNSSSLCPGAQTGLTANMYATIVGNDSTACNPNGPLCQVYCSPGYNFDSSTYTCIQPKLGTCLASYQIGCQKDWGYPRNYVNDFYPFYHDTINGRVYEPGEYMCGYPSLGSSYIMWAAPSVNATGWDTTVYTRIITIPATGDYDIRWGVDDTATIAISNSIPADSTCLADTNMCGGCATNGRDCKVYLPAGKHLVTISAVNNGDNWGGVMMDIGTVTTVNCPDGKPQCSHFSSLNPPINTGPNPVTGKVDQWTSSVICNSNLIWNCKKFDCE